MAPYFLIKKEKKKMLSKIKAFKFNINVKIEKVTLSITFPTKL